MFLYRLKKKIKTFINYLLNFFNLRLVDNLSYLELIKDKNANFDLKFLFTIANKHIVKTHELFKFSKSQNKQDLLVLNKLDFKTKGFFVEFGACDGITKSNTYLLEKNFNWDGIVVEPAKVYLDSLSKNRKCIIENLIVYNSSDMLIDFNEVSNPELSTISDFNDSDKNNFKRKFGKSYQVKTISLYDLLKKNNAPNVIDFLSIDTEGSEYSILEQFKFDEYKFRVIVVEHNYTQNRQKIYDLLSKNKYKRFKTELSGIDDYYYLEI